MKHLKEFKTFESVQEIDSICKKYGIENYSVNKDGSVDVEGDVYLSYKKLTKLPLKFGSVSGDFLCNNNSLPEVEERLIKDFYTLYGNYEKLRLVQDFLDVHDFKNTTEDSYLLDLEWVTEFTYEEILRKISV